MTTIVKRPNALRQTTKAEKPLRFRPLLLIPLLAAFLIGVNVVITESQDKLEAHHLESQIESLNVAYQELLTGYERSAQIIYNEIVNQPEVLSLFAQANSTSEEQQAEVRAELYALLIDQYQRLETLNLRQLHFHLPDDRSFLRFHQPDVFGDDLTGIRYTVTYANTQLEPIAGFEEGRIFNGFRYVFPLFYEGAHIGSVETSVSFSAIQQDMNASLSGGTTFILKSDVVEAKVFEEQQANYVLSDITDAYAYDRQVVENYADDDMPWATITAINGALGSGIDEQLAEEKPFVRNLTVNGKDYTVTFLTILNVENAPVGYILSYVEDPFISDSRTRRLLSQVVIGVASLVVIVFMWFLDRSLTLVNKQRDQLASQNVTLEETNVALDKARLEAEAANRLKSQFLANMSHELRTPLNAIMNFTRFVSEGMLGLVNTEQVDTLGKVSENGKHLLGLINDLLDISKIEAGQLKLFLEDNIDLQKEFNAVVDVAGSLLVDKPVILIKENNQPLPLIMGDRRRIRQIMLNLVSNACKFTVNGEIRLMLKQHESEIWFSVQDTGPGIAPEDHELIFQTFTQTAHGIKQGGTGLGLPISRRLAEIHGGCLEMTSAPGYGSTFTLKLPVQSEQLKAQLQEQIVAFA